MTRRIVGHGAKARYYLGDREVTEAAFWAAAPAVAESAGPVSLVGFKPLVSDALAVHPRQVPEAVASAKAKGVPVEFQADGRPRFTSSRQMREYAKAYGFRHHGY